jgi:hypothetical protein
MRLRCKRPRRMMCLRARSCPAHRLEPGNNYPRVAACMSRAEFLHIRRGQELLERLRTTPDEAERVRIYREWLAGSGSPQSGDAKP